VYRSGNSFVLPLSSGEEVRVGRLVGEFRLVNLLRAKTTSRSLPMSVDTI
jgi:hypothetical protein